MHPMKRESWIKPVDLAESLVGQSPRGLGVLGEEVVLDDRRSILLATSLGRQALEELVEFRGHDGPARVGAFLTVAKARLDRVSIGWDWI
jgi:hypothetical protein